VDGLATISNEKNLVLYVWYDNEFGYSCQVVRVMEEMAGVNPPSFPAKETRPSRMTPNQTAGSVHAAPSRVR
jgi:glyceraldehyde 3-phosphate dehydrogenase